MINRLTALALLVMLSPFFIFVSFILFITQGRPILFYQKRVGYNFVTFNLFKYRTMNINDSGPLITVENDFRITKIGKYLRKFKIDEFPQILNIILGDLNFVGPRPEVEKYVNKNDFKFLKKVKPGLTDFSSILFSREDIVLSKLDGLNSYESVLQIKIDLINYYLKVKSLPIDVKIILLTIFKLITPRLVNNIIKKEIYLNEPVLFSKISKIGL